MKLVLVPILVIYITYTCNAQYDGPPRATLSGAVPPRPFIPGAIPVPQLRAGPRPQRVLQRRPSVAQNGFYRAAPVPGSGPTPQPHLFVTQPNQPTKPVTEEPEEEINENEQTTDHFQDHVEPQIAQKQALLAQLNTIGSNYNGPIHAGPAPTQYRPEHRVPVRGQQRNQIQHVEPQEQQINVARSFQQAPPQARSRPQARPAPQALPERSYVSNHPDRARKPVAQILRKYNDQNPDGSITWGYENDDGSFKEETIGADCITRGKYGYVDPDGVVREYSYETGLPCNHEKEEELRQAEHDKLTQQFNVARRPQN